VLSGSTVSTWHASQVIRLNPRNERLGCLADKAEQLAHFNGELAASFIVRCSVLSLAGGVYGFCWLANGGRVAAGGTDATTFVIEALDI